MKKITTLLSASVLIASGHFVPAQASSLSASEVRKVMLGKNIVTRRFGMRITMRYNSNGTVSAKSFLGNLKGTWRGRGNRICTTFPSGPAKGTDCVSFTKTGPNRYRSSAGVSFSVSN